MEYICRLIRRWLFQGIHLEVRHSQSYSLLLTKRRPEGRQSPPSSGWPISIAVSPQYRLSYSRSLRSFPAPAMDPRSPLTPSRVSRTPPLTSCCNGRPFRTPTLSLSTSSLYDDQF